MEIDALSPTSTPHLAYASHCTPLLLREHARAFEVLPDAELLGRVLSTGPFAAAPALGDLLELSRRELEDSFGLQAPEIDRLAAVCQLAIRLARAPIAQGDLLSHPEAVVRYLALRYGRRSQELMGALFVDIRNRLVDECELYLGTLSRAAVEPRAIFERALACRAAGFLLFHNHPSGDPSPSAEDLVFTRRLADAGEVMGIRLVDHLVVGHGGRFVSLRRTGGW